MSLTGRARVSRPTTKRISLPRWASTSTTPPAITSPTFSLDGHKCSLLICYDLRFPELFRTLALQGVELLLLPAQWPAARRYHWETLTAARAIENQLFLAACNSCGTAGEYCVRRRVARPRSPRRAARRRRSGRGDRHRRARFFRPCGGPQLHQRLSRPSAGAISSLK